MQPIKSRKRQRGFSLVELLIVISIVAILATASGPAFSALTTSGTANENLSQLSGILEQARQYAVAQNTYVWVAFYAPANTNPKQVSVAVIASKDGTDPASNNATPWQTYAYGSLSTTSSLVLVNKIVTLKQVSLQNASTFSSSTLPTLPTTPTVSTNNSMATNANGFFQIQVPGTTSDASFTQAIEFTPSGQAQNSSSPIGVIDLDVQPQKGNIDDAKNVAVIRINGLTGQNSLYRE